MKRVLRLAWLSIGLSGLIAACASASDGDGGGGGNRSPELTGSACEVADDCFPGVAEGELQGDPLCLDRVRDGYCTHTCDTDDDCCAADGECRTSLPQVCSPFESTNMKMCFLSCEPEDIPGDAGNDDQAFCQRYSGPDFICRSSGGGNQNRKICVPGTCGVGADCADDNDCNGLTCFTTFAGGYCGQRDCTTNDDCPGDSSCVTDDDGENYCFKNCRSASDCSYCRHDSYYATCSQEVDFAEAGTTGSVCVPLR